MEHAHAPDELGVAGLRCERLLEYRASRLGRARAREAEGEDAERRLDLVERAHAGREDDAAGRARDLEEERRVGEVARGDLDRP